MCFLSCPIFHQIIPNSPLFSSSFGHETLLIFSVAYYSHNLELVFHIAHFTFLCIFSYTYKSALILALFYQPLNSIYYYTFIQIVQFITTYYF